jgi:ATP-dependent helicase/nuclease subunit B
MEKFVDKIANYVKESDIKLEDWVIILPSERAKHYLQSALYKAYQKPIFSPEIHTIHQWVRSLTKETILDKTRLLLNLFEVHKTIGKEKIDSVFDEFMLWGNTLLSDFDEMERYQIQPKELFRNLRDIKEIENWSFGEEHELTERQQRFLEFWERLPSYYQAFQEKLQAINATYSGKAYRNIAENIDIVFEKNKNAHFLFAGFNALSTAEKNCIKQLHQLGRGHVFIDADVYYYEDKNHEAGAFLRVLANYLEIKKLPVIQKRIQVETKKIEIISCAQNTGQTKVAGTLLSQFDEKKISETLVLLADETLIVPLLNSIPKSVGKANITLGLPLKNSSLRTWMELLFRIQEGIEKYGREIVYHKDILTFWNHPFISSILTNEEEFEIREREKRMRKFNTVFQDPKKIKVSSRIDEILRIVYASWNSDWKIALSNIRSLNKILFYALDKKLTFEKAILESFDKSIIDFQNCVHENFPSMSLRTFKNLFNQEWMSSTMAYYGNPLEGLQIMGLLETRLLDFKTILVIGMNEGKMPPTNAIQTLIPMDLRKYLGMPTPRDKQGLFAHHFYRLLHHCEEMYITYTTTTEGVNSNEPSRYLLQLELELCRENKNITLIKSDYTLPSTKTKTDITEIQKTEEVITKIDDLLAKGISASAFKTFFTCPLDFYYKYILRFGETEQVDESIESNQLGTFVHEVLEDLYRPYSKRENNGEIKNPLPPKIFLEDIQRFEKDFPLLLREKFSAHFEGNPEAFAKGKNYLSFTMANELTKRFLKFEAKKLKESNLGIAIEALEERFEIDMEVSVFGNKKNIKLKGFADRIDSIGDEIRIIDYKTGKVKSEDVGKALTKFEGTNEELLIELSKKSKHFFQLMLYSFMYYKKYGKIPQTSAIISLVNLNESPFISRAGKLSNEEVIALFPAVLQQILEEIYATETPFIHNSKNYFNYCTFCS